jgi:hypothetical protein
MASQVCALVRMQAGDSNVGGQLRCTSFKQVRASVTGTVTRKGRAIRLLALHAAAHTNALA